MYSSPYYRARIHSKTDFRAGTHNFKIHTSLNNIKAFFLSQLSHKIKMNVFSTFDYKTSVYNCFISIVHGSNAYNIICFSEFFVILLLFWYC